MAHRYRVILLILSFTMLFTAAAAVQAQETTFWAPDVVVADGDGTFTYVTVLTAGDGVVGWAAYCWSSMENVEGGVCVDSFCVDPQPIAAGSILTYEVSGRLVDPAQNGRVYADNYFCVGGGGAAETLIQAPAVDNDRANWGTVKARYR